MGSQILEVTRQGIWASFTGGWFYDPRQTIFCNTFHLYLWLFLLCLPFTLYLYFPCSILTWSIYCSTLAVLFLILKFLSYRLHGMFDTSECFVEELCEKSNDTNDDSDKSLRKRTYSFKEIEDIELKDFKGNEIYDGSENSGENFRPRQSSHRLPDNTSDKERDRAGETSVYEPRNLEVDIHCNNGDSADLQCHVNNTHKLNFETGRSSLKSNDGRGPVSSSNRGNPMSNIPASHTNDSNGSKLLLQSFSMDENNSSDPLYAVPLSLVKKASSLPTNNNSLCAFGSKNFDGEVMSNRSQTNTSMVLKNDSDEENLPMSFGASVHERLLEKFPFLFKDGIIENNVGNPSLLLRTNDDILTVTKADNLRRSCKTIDRSYLLECKDDYEDEDNTDNPQGSRSPLLSQTDDRVTENVHGSSISKLKILNILKIIVDDAELHDRRKTLTSHSPNSLNDVSSSYRFNANASCENVRKLSDKKNVSNSANSSPFHTTVETSQSVSTISLCLSDYIPENEHQDVNRSNPNSKANLYKMEPENHNEIHEIEGMGSHCSCDYDVPEDLLEASVTAPESGSESGIKLRHDSLKSVYSLNWLFENTTLSDNNNLPEQRISVPDYSTTGARPKKRLVNKVSCDSKLEETLGQILMIEDPSERLIELEKLKALKQNNESDSNENDDPNYKSRLQRKNAIRKTSHCKSGTEQSDFNDPSEGFPMASSNINRYASLQESFDGNDITLLCLDRPPVNKHQRKRVKRSPNSYTAMNSILAQPGTHLASSHEDTSEGAIHCFQDELGNWISYTFSESGTGTAGGVVPVSNPNIMKKLLTSGDCSQIQKTSWIEGCSSDTSSAGSGMTVVLDNPSVVFQPIKNNVCINSTPDLLPTTIYHRPNLDHASLDHFTLSNVFQSSLTSAIRNPRSPLQLLAESLLERTRNVAQTTRPVSEVSSSFPISSQVLPDTNVDAINKPRFTDFSEKKAQHYYKFYLSSCFPVKVRFDRLALLALIDQNTTILENVISLILAILVAVLGSFILKLGYYHDFYVFVFCFVIASCQYCLIKSVQPDAASPMHGYNKIIVYSRPFYFILCSSMILLIHFVLAQSIFEYELKLYGIVINFRKVLVSVQYFLKYFLLMFPVLFSIGLLPQVNTFCMYLFEQIDMFIFGGNAITGLVSSMYCLLRSLFGVALLFGFAFGALREPLSSQHILFSIYCALVVSVSYHLSRSAGDPIPLWNLIKKNIIEEDEKNSSRVTESSNDPDELRDPLPEKLQSTICARMKTDVITCAILSIMIFGIHTSANFLTFEPMFNEVLWAITCTTGFIVHYIMPNMKKHLPWLCLAQPIFKSHEYEAFEAFEMAKVMWFEKAYVWAWFIEKNVLYPIIFISALTKDSPVIVSKFGPVIGAIIVVVCSLKILRTGYSDSSKFYFVLCMTILFFNFDCKDSSESFLMNFFIMHIVIVKLNDLLLKVSFVVTYIAPWQITWGSAFHAFAQPFSVPHSGMLFLQALISAILSTPLTPFLGSAIFLTSYVRPVKFWERDYNTRRVDHSNTRLSSHIEQNPGADDNNLNSIFYEHLTRSLQHSLSGDLMLGRWGQINQGDVFVLASDNLNCLVHLIEIGNGLVTFQVRGLEFRGTYCQQREVEAISEGVQEDIGCCCCEPGHLPHLLSVNAAFNQRWLAWEVTATKYILEGYSISDNSAGSILQLYEVRKILIRYYVKAIIYYTIKSNKLNVWLSNPSISEALEPSLEKTFADLDPVFNLNIDEDYDFRISGISRNSFCSQYLEWIQFCVAQNDDDVDSSRNSKLVSLCLCLSLLGRRTLSSTSHNTLGSVEMFLHGLHNLFKGVFDTSSARDEWVFSDMELVKRVIIPSIRMSLKLHQDHFTFHDEYDNHETLYEAICQHEENLIIAHEGDPVWRNAVLCGRPSLLALRHIQDEGSYEYKIIMLNKRHLTFRVIKVNKECVRGLWAGQQQELVYLRNKNPERGSIQNAKQALRNIINSSCDQPIGYPIYVSPLTTSYSETNPQITSIIGGHFNYGYIRDTIMRFFKRIKRRCGDGCINGSASASQDEGGFRDHGSQNTDTLGKARFN